MRELFDRLLAEGEDGIDRLVAERTQESVTLDFKGKADPRHGRMKDDDRRYFAKALSAFSNSAGGLLIFGVDARKVDGVDCAQEAKPIDEIERFKSEATTDSGQILQPRHDGIRVEMIPSKRQPGAGYLLVHVERSERRPHRSEASGQKQYYKRAGDNSFEMEHYDIEDAFKRNTMPELAIYMKHRETIFERTTDVNIYDLYLTNEGRVTADNVYCRMIDLRNCIIATNSNLSIPEGGVSLLEGLVPQSINPGLSLKLDPLVIHSDIITAQTHMVYFRCIFGARDALPKTAEISSLIIDMPQAKILVPTRSEF